MEKGKRMSDKGPPLLKSEPLSGLGSVTALPIDADVALIHDATASVKGMVYQIGVAVLKCYEMARGQKVLIERCGDVTIEGSEQIETKLYSGNLTDGHINLWKTLFNWTQEDFNPADYSALILYTNQSLGPRAKIAEWNSASVSRRLEILNSIQERTKEEAGSGKRARGTSDKLSTVAMYQQEVLGAGRAHKLNEVVTRFTIEHSSPDILGLHDLIQDRFIKGIYPGKTEAFLNTLVGFVLNRSATQKVWEISFNEFSREVGDLTSTYCRETRIFPRRFFDDQPPPGDDIIGAHKEHKFVRELTAIEHDEMIPEAVRDYTSTLSTIQTEFMNYEVPRQRTRAYSEELLKIFKARYRVASRSITDVITDSKNLYDNFLSESPPAFEGFESPPYAFRNGVIHTHMNDEKLALCWKVGQA
jgi:hypothetical protein